MRSPSPDSPRPVPRAAVAADIVAGVLILIGLLVVFFGPTPRLHLGSERLSISSPARAFMLAAIIAAVRHWLVPYHPVLRRFLAPLGTDDADLDRRLGRPLLSGWRGVGEVLIVTAGFAALVAVVTWPQIARLDAVPDLGDPLFSTWRIAWIAHQIVRDPLHLFDGNIFYPEKLTLTYSDPVIVPALMSAPLIWLGVHQLTAYTLLFLSGFALSGVTTYLLVRDLTGRRDAAVVSGIIFAICPYRFEHYSHLELQMAMWMPLVLWGLHRTIVTGRMRDGLITGVAFGLQTLSSLYYGCYLAVCLVPLAAVLWIARGRPWAPVRALTAGALVTAMMAAPVAVQYARNSAMLGERHSDEVQSYSATPGDFFRPHFRSRFYGAWSDGGLPERQIFPGVVPMALTAVAIWPPLNVVRLGYTAALAIAADGALGYNGSTFRWLREWVKPFRGLRVPARFAIVVSLMLAVLSGFGVATILDRWPRWRVPLTAIALALVVAEPWPRLFFEDVPKAPPAIYDSLPSSPPAVLVEFPLGWDRQGAIVDPQYLYFSTFHWQRLLNGNSGFFPPSSFELQESAQSFPAPEAIDYLKTRGVEYIGVHGAFMRTHEYREAVNTLRRRPDVSFVARGTWYGKESRLYRLR